MDRGQGRRDESEAVGEGADMTGAEGHGIVRIIDEIFPDVTEVINTIGSGSHWEKEWQEIEQKTRELLT